MRNRICNNRHPARGTLAGIAFFVIISCIWGYVSGFLGLIFDLDLTESWWQRVGAFAVVFIPELIFLFLAWRISSRSSGRRAGLITLGVCLALIIAGFIALVAYAH